MKKLALIIDIDNTIVDTAVRKQSLLKNKLGVTEHTNNIERIRCDYHLHGFLGDQVSDMYKAFFLELESPTTIASIPAPSFPGAVDTICWMIDHDYDVNYMTDRQESLREVTLLELESIGIKTNSEHLHMRPTSRGSITVVDPELGSSKVEIIEKLHRDNDVVAVIGDRIEDVSASQRLGVATVLFKSTLTDQELERARSLNKVGLKVCRSWAEVAVAVDQFRAGSKQMAELRNQFINQYASWLKDIDNKSQMVVLISAALSGFAGNVVLKDSFTVKNDWLLMAALVLSVISMVYAIRSFTSRYMSGALTARPVATRVKQWISIFLDWPQKWKYVQNDALDEYYKLRKTDEIRQSRAHLRFFQERYHAHDPDSLLNLRLYEMRAANYAKLYPERLASKLLITAILCSALWVVWNAAPHIIEFVCNYPPFINTPICVYNQQ